MVTIVLNITLSTKRASILHCSSNIYNLVGIGNNVLAIIVIIFIIIVRNLIIKSAVKVIPTGLPQIWGAGCTPVNRKVFSFTARFNTTVTHVCFRSP